MINRMDKLDTISKSKKIDAYLLTSGAAVRYLSGYFYNFEVNPSLFHMIQAAVFAIPGCYQGLIVADNESEQLHGLDPRIHVIPYTNYVQEKPLDFENIFRTKLIDVIKNNRLRIGRLGVEADFLPFSVCEFLAANFPDIELIDVSVDLAAMRLIKDEHEISLIRAATHLCDVGQEAVVKYAQAGMTELDLFKLVRGDMEKEAGRRIPIVADLVSGLRTFDGGGNPSLKKIEKDDLVLCELKTCLNGYWGSSCSTIAVTKVKPSQSSHFLLVKEALNKGITAIKPGVKANSIDHLLRSHLSHPGNDRPGGHGIGLSFHEEPIINPTNETILSPNMVLALKPGIYINNYGIRLERLVLVTNTGCEILLGFNHTLERDTVYQG